MYDGLINYFNIHINIFALHSDQKRLKNVDVERVIAALGNTAPKKLSNLQSIPLLGIHRTQEHSEKV